MRSIIWFTGYVHGSSATKKIYIYTHIYMERKVDANTPATLPLLLSLDKWNCMSLKHHIFLKQKTETMPNRKMNHILNIRSNPQKVPLFYWRPKQNLLHIVQIIQPDNNKVCSIFLPRNLSVLICCFTLRKKIKLHEPGIVNKDKNSISIKFLEHTEYQKVIYRWYIIKFHDF